jgi:hypothetical protein
MKIAKLFLPGRFEDAFVYMGRIVVLTEERTIQFWDFDKIAAHVAEINVASNPASAFMFSRNDWLSSSLFKEVMRNADVAREIVSAFDRFPQPYYEVKAQEFQISEEDLPFSARVLLDMNIYQSRIYLGADSGLFHIDADWSDRQPILQAHKKRTDARCVRTSVGFGAINASCGSEGLFSAEDDFGWAGRRNGLRKVASESFRSGWLHFDLMNYSSTTFPTLLKSEYRRAERGETDSEHERRIVTTIGTEEIDLSDLFGVIRDQYNVQAESIQYAYNSSSVIFIHTIDGHFYSLGIKTPKQGRPQLTFRRTYKGSQTRILSANWTSLGLVVETDNRVLLFAHNDWFPIQESEAISVRTFPRSRRYRNTVLITTEEGILIVGLFDETSAFEPAVNE